MRRSQNPCRSSIGLDVRPVNPRDAGEIERAVTAVAHSPNAGLVVTASALSIVHRDLIVTLAQRHKLPAVYPRRSFVTAGGLMSYGFDALEQGRQAAGTLRGQLCLLSLPENLCSVGNDRQTGTRR